MTRDEAIAKAVRCRRLSRESPVRGERKAALAALERLLTAHGLTEADLPIYVAPGAQPPRAPAPAHAQPPVAPWGVVIITPNPGWSWSSTGTASSTDATSNGYWSPWW